MYQNYIATFLNNSFLIYCTVSIKQKANHNTSTILAIFLTSWLMDPHPLAPTGIVEMHSFIKRET